MTSTPKKDTIPSSRTKSAAADVERQARQLCDLYRNMWPNPNTPEHVDQGLQAQTLIMEYLAAGKEEVFLRAVQLLEESGEAELLQRLEATLEWSAQTLTIGSKPRCDRWELARNVPRTGHSMDAKRPSVGASGHGHPTLFSHIRLPSLQGR